MEFSVCDLKSDEVQDANSEEDFSQREAQYAHSAKGSVDRIRTPDSQIEICTRTRENEKINNSDTTKQGTRDV